MQTDGDLNYVPGSLWTAAHHRLPMLVVMHNNRAYHQELMYAQYIAGVRGRGGDRAHIGTTFRDPFISYAKLGEAYGVESEGPIEDPDDLLPALDELVAALAEQEAACADIVKTGRTHLMDAVPLTLGQEFSGWRHQVAAAQEDIMRAQSGLSV